ncbi:MAG: ABC transporter permease [Pseudomonadales bacterium]
MTAFSLIRAGLLRKPTRTVLTLLSLMVAFLLFMLLQAITAAFAGGAPVPGVQRIMVDAKYSMTDNLPLSHVRAMTQIEGVAEVTQMVWFGGYYQDPKNEFAKAPVDHTRIFSVFPELIVAEDVLERFHASKRAVVVEATLAQRYGWQTGDVIPIVADIWPKDDGSWHWEFILAGTYQIPAGSRIQPWFFLRWDYFNESVMDWVKNQVGWAVLRVEEGVGSKAVIDRIDALFEHSSDPTKSLSEDAMARQFANQLGDIGAIASMILAAVFFTILLLTANVAALSFHERIADLAVMKTLGFGDRYVATLIFAECVGLFLIGALGGIGIGFGLEPVLQETLAPATGRFQMTWQDAVLGIAMACGLAVAIALYPTWSANRLPIVDALREGG